MKNILKLVASVLLIITGTFAVYWGMSLISVPDGSGLHLPDYPFKNSVFSDYFLAGIILFVGPGLFSFFVLLALVLKPEVSSALVIAHGVMLTICVLVLMGVITEVSLLHAVYLVFGWLLILSGIFLKRLDRSEFYKKQLF